MDHIVGIYRKQALSRAADALDKDHSEAIEVLRWLGNSGDCEATIQLTERH